MSIFLSEEISETIGEIMFQDFGNTEAEEFLKKELERYKPQFRSWKDEEIQDFINYQRQIWLENLTPEIGKIISCLNPTFVDSVESIVVEKGIYTCVSEKENGYRFQLHNHPEHVSAFTRQFTPYDLRMFPELDFSQLPVMIGDAELINKKYKHLAGFNRVNSRIPNTKYWPIKGTTTIDEEILNEYLNGELLRNGQPLKEFEMTLAFHGIFAIANPDTWEKSKKEQLESLESLCALPMNYERVDEILDQLQNFLKQKKINAKVVKKKVVKTKKQLETYVKKNEKKGLEGSVIVQYSGRFDCAKSIKIKNYETVDAVLLGVYLHKKEDNLTQENLKGALLGLYDETLQKYLPVCKVNLDSDGVQIKTIGQRERLNALREGLVEVLKTKKLSGEIKTFHDVFVEYAKTKLGEIIKCDFTVMFEEIPRGQNFLTLLETYNVNKQGYDKGLGSKKSAKKSDRWIYEHKNVLEQVTNKEVINYLSQYSEVKKASNKLVKPQLTVSTEDPVILEAQVFDIKYNCTGFAAGFNPETIQSFHFNNCFAERIRNDKSTTTDYQTIDAIAQSNTVNQKSF